MFCPKCGSIMMPGLKDGKKVLKCRCGHVSEETEKMKISDKKKEETEGKELEVVDEAQDDVTKPLVDEECPKCGHKKAYFWEIQTRAGDEPPTKFFKCEKCKHTWRDYS